jgi:hypothetical protein
LTPVVTIELSVNVDPAHLYSTQILITNRGHVPVYNLTFSCGFGVGGGSLMVNSFSSGDIDVRPVAMLGAGQPVTRACAANADIEGNTTLAFEMNYNWPIIGWREKKRATFRVKKGPSGYFLLPEVIP